MTYIGQQNYEIGNQIKKTMGNQGKDAGRKAIGSID